MYKFLKGVVGFFIKILYKIEVYGKENVPKEGPLILCANHKSLLDPIVLAVAMDRQVHFMGKEELWDNPILKFLLDRVGAFPVNRSKSDLKSIRTSMAILKRGDVLGIFPEGTRVKTVSIENIKEGIGMLSNRSKSIIQPVFIDTEYKMFKPVKIHFRKQVNPLDFSECGREINREITKAVYYKIYDIKE
ncbi:lysophospholipid acyltransferase family protein [Lagierella sp.]|uniref:lysophospholipid acyltransferase family protein n=1 Tax=Lagierella sp. TaxID=2849657 RepID=UPI0026032DDA|nr:lysophospholipid acyltransferase family protein [Lagierella sp.]